MILEPSHSRGQSFATPSKPQDQERPNASLPLVDELAAVAEYSRRALEHLGMIQAPKSPVAGPEFLSDAPSTEPSTVKPVIEKKPN